MRIADMNWMQVRDHVAGDDRAVLPIGSTEQHAYLSLAVDAILAERVAVEAAEPIGVAVFPVVNYGLTPSFVEYPGTVTLRMSTFCAVVDRPARRDRARRLQEDHDRQRARRQLARPRRGARMARPPSRSPGQVAQLVERAEDACLRPGDRSGGLARVLDGELPMDASRQREDAGHPEADDADRPLPATRPRAQEGVARRRQLRRPLPAQRRGYARRSGR